MSSYYRIKRISISHWKNVNQFDKTLLYAIMYNGSDKLILDMLLDAHSCGDDLIQQHVSKLFCWNNERFNIDPKIVWC